MQYDGDIARAKKVLGELSQYYPEATSYEVAGFFGGKEIEIVAAKPSQVVMNEFGPPDQTAS